MDEGVLGRGRAQLNAPENAGSLIFLEELMGEGGLKTTRLELDAGIVGSIRIPGVRR